MILQGLHFDSSLKSDTACLNHLATDMLSASKKNHVLRDPTRGGVGSTLNEIAVQSKIGIVIYEEKIPLRDDVNGACELLGLDPLYLANEGKLLAFVAEADADKVLAARHENIHGNGAEIIGEVTTSNAGRVLMKTAIGSSRIVDMLTGEQLPWIC